MNKIKKNQRNENKTKYRKEIREKLKYIQENGNNLPKHEELTCALLRHR